MEPITPQPQPSSVETPPTPVPGSMVVPKGFVAPPADQPDSAPTPTASVAESNPQPTVPTPPPVPEAVPAPVAPVAESEPEVSADEDTVPDDATEEPEAPAEAAFQWQASEYVHHHKNTSWYASLIAIVVILLGVAAITKQWLGIAVFVTMGVAVIVYARRAPRTLLYQLDSSGITIESKHYAFTQFRSFGVTRDTEWHTIDLEPAQRFMPRLTILFDEADFDAVVGHLNDYLPRADRDPDLVDRLTRYIRF